MHAATTFNLNHLGSRSLSHRPSSLAVAFHARFLFLLLFFFLIIPLAKLLITIMGTKITDTAGHVLPVFFVTSSVVHCVVCNYSLSPTTSVTLQHDKVRPLTG